MPRVAIAANDSWNIINYRLGLLRVLLDVGFEVTVIAPESRHRPAIEGLGATFAPVSMQPRGTSPFADLALFARYRRLLQTLKPDAFLGFTAKPNIWGSMAARSLGIPVIANISGLGAVFAKGGALMNVMIRLYRIALANRAMVFFQNPEDRERFLRARIIGEHQARLVPGSGIDLDRFTSQRVRKRGGGTRFLFAGRLLWAKGVREYVAAGQSLAERKVDADLAILGIIERAGPGSVPLDTLRYYERSGQAHYLGAADDVRSAIANADCIVLPTYYGEGVPHILLEAAAMGRPCIATDTPGCRDAVEDGVTGFLVAPRSVDELAEAMARVAGMTPAQRELMGNEGRRKMERSFNQHLVHQRYLETLKQLDVRA